MFNPLFLATLVAMSAPACDAPTALIAQPPSSVHFQSAFDATVWGGERIQTNSTLSLNYADAGIVAQSVDSATKKSQTINDAQVGACGAISSNSQPQLFVSFNNALALARGGVTAPKVGDSWKATIKLYASQTQEIDVPVSVKVTRNDASGIVLQATGTASSTLTQYGTPISLNYQAVALYAHGELRQAQSAAQEDVQAGPQSQTMTFKWSLSPQR